jgi:predicted phosphohydrolase
MALYAIGTHLSLGRQTHGCVRSAGGYVEKLARDFQAVAPEDTVVLAGISWGMSLHRRKDFAFLNAMREKKLLLKKHD